MKVEKKIYNMNEERGDIDTNETAIEIAVENTYGIYLIHVEIDSTSNNG